jgi:hypothetical protein
MSGRAVLAGGRAGIAALLLLLAAGCSGSDGPNTLAPGRSGSLAITVAGLPGGAAAAVTVTGPGGYSTGLTGTGPLTGLAVGLYTIAAQPVVSGGETWVPIPGSQSVVVGSSPASISVTYIASTGSLTVTVTGLPGALADVRVSGPGGYVAVVTATQTLSGLSPGTYQVLATAIAIAGETYAPTPTSQAAVVAVGFAASAGVAYAPTSGSLTLTIAGLPAGVPASVTVSGGEGASHQVAGSQTLNGLAPGAWTVSATTVTSGATTLWPAPLSQVVVVAAGDTASASVTYALAPPTTLNLRIAGAYLTQAVQRLDQGVELVEGRDAIFRVFAVANAANTAQPAVQVRLFHGTTEIQAVSVRASSPSVAQAVNEGNLPSSWNLLIPGPLVVPGLRLLAEVDPDQEFAELDEGDNVFPASGDPLAVTVRSLLPFQIRLVPVLQSVNVLQGNVTLANAEGYLSVLRTMLPIGAYEVDVGAVYTTNAPELQGGNANGAWGTILSEILALRNAVDMSTRYYYGVVQTTYSSGVAGIGYVGSPGGTFKAAIGWDRSGSRAGVLAHELGHNFGRLHAPCGSPANPDPGYPHPGGQIGAWGLHVETLEVKVPTQYFDLMGYCNSDWVSDYTWNGVMAFRAASPTGAPAATVAGGSDDGLLVWGRVTPAGVVLEPAFRVAPTGAVLPASGVWRIEGRDAAGAVLVSQSFDPVAVADLPGGVEWHFAMVLPVGAALADRLETIRLVGPGGTAERRARPVPDGQAAAPSARVVGPGRRRVVWDAGRHSMALVRDGATGEILSFARAGAIELWSSASALDLQLSDGVRVERRRVVVQ